MEDDRSAFMTLENDGDYARERKVKPIEVEEKPKDLSKEQAIKELMDLENKPEYTKEQVKEIIRDNIELRRVYLEVIKNQPVIASDIRDKIDCVKQTIYNHLKKLRVLRLVDEIKVLEIWSKDYCNKKYSENCKIELLEEEKIVLNKFKSWSNSLKEKRRNYFIGVTGYWKLTEFGGSQEMINHALRTKKCFVSLERKN